MVENVIQIKTGITINVDVSAKTHCVCKKVEILVHVLVKMVNI